MPFRCPAAATATIRSLQRAGELEIRACSARSIFTSQRAKDRKHLFTKTRVSTREFRRDIHSSKARAPSKGHRRAWEPKDFPIEDQLPPSALLKSAKKSKALNIEPEDALNILRRYIDLSREKPRGWESQVCQEHKITPQTLTLLGLILNKVPERPKSVLGRSLLISASSLGDPSATIHLLRFGLRTNSIERPEYVAPIQRLTELASAQPSAMVLLGRIYASQGRDHLALNLFRRAASVGMPDGAENPVAGEALVYQGEMLQRQGNDVAAKEAFQRAALDHDNALGYYYLGQLQERGSALQEEYFQKAASSGVSNAWHPLADLYFDRAKSDSSTREAMRSDFSIEAFPPGTGVEDIKQKLREKIEEMKKSKGGSGEYFDMGKEWLFLSANAGNWNSIVHLASLLKSEGGTASGLGWLAVAEKVNDPKLAEVAREMRKEWLAQVGT